MREQKSVNAKTIIQMLIMGWFSAILLVFAGCTTTPVKPHGAEITGPTDTVRRITGVHVVAEQGGEAVVIAATRPLAEKYTLIRQPSPPRIIIVFRDTNASGLKPEIPENSSVVSSITTAQTPDGRNLRMEILLKKDVPYDVTQLDSSMKILFAVKSGETAAPVAGPSVYGEKETSPDTLHKVEDQAVKFAEQERIPGKEKQETQERMSYKANQGKESPVTINRIDFMSADSGKSSITIGADGKIDYALEKVGSRKLLLRIFNARLPKNRRNRPLITTRFNSAIDRIIPVVAPERPETVDILIELREAVPYRVLREKDNMLALWFEPSKIGPRPLALANLPPWRKAMEEVRAFESESMKQKGVPAEKKSRNDYESLFGPSGPYTGEKIALDFFETDIRNVFTILQQVSGKNFAIDPDVRGKVTISMEKPVPWDQVFDLILQMNKLGKIEQGDIIRIARLSTLRAEETERQKQIEAYRKRRQQEKSLEPLITEYIPINYANAKDEILLHIKDILTKDRGKVSVDERNNQIIITDVAEKIDKAKEIISKIDKVTPQVVIEARIVEVTDNFSREIGVDWGVKSEDVYRDDINGYYSYNVSMNYPANATSSIGFDFVRLPNMGTPLVLNAKLNAMERKGEGKIISAPKIVTLDNKTATIKQGSEYPYETRDENGVVKTEFKPIELTLQVTPHITADKRIAMKILIEKDDVAQITDEGPALATNSAETELLVEDGSTIVIGGILKKSINTQEFGFPILKDIPMVGWLFRSTTNGQEKRELLIFMTPRIVQLEQKEFAVSGQ